MCVYIQIQYIYTLWLTWQRRSSIDNQVLSGSIGPTLPADFQFTHVFHGISRVVRTADDASVSSLQSPYRLISSNVLQYATTQQEKDKQHFLSLSLYNILFNTRNSITYFNPRINFFFFIILFFFFFFIRLFLYLFIPLVYFYFHTRKLFRMDQFRSGLIYREQKVCPNCMFVITLVEYTYTYTYTHQYIFMSKYVQVCAKRDVIFVSGCTHADVERTVYTHTKTQHTRTHIMVEATHGCVRCCDGLQQVVMVVVFIFS